jgi:hypothetical protein
MAAEVASGVNVRVSFEILNQYTDEYYKTKEIFAHIDEKLVEKAKNGKEKLNVSWKQIIEWTGIPSLEITTYFLKLKRHYNPLGIKVHLVVAKTKLEGHKFSFFWKRMYEQEGNSQFKEEIY